MSVRAVFFDVGETLVDETRLWASWADWLRVSHLTFFAALGGIIERREHHRKVFDLIRPGIDLGYEEAARAAAGVHANIEPTDFYPDALPCLHALRAQGYLIGLAGNQPAAAEQQLLAMGLPVDVVASSADWGVEKPSPLFFERVIQAAGMPASAIAYVGDRLDNDVLPATDAGMVSVFLRRGPWGYLHATRPEAARAHIRLDSLVELPAAIGGWWVVGGR